MNKEDALDQAIAKLKNGTRKEDLNLNLPASDKTELLALLEIYETFQKIPKNQVPQPAMQRKYILEPVKNGLWFLHLRFVKFVSTSVAFLLLVSSLAVTVRATINSLPGETLFSLKKTAERLQLSFTSDPVQKANLELQLTQKRLSEAQSVFGSPQQNPQQEIAALAELSNQTKTTLEQAKNAAIHIASNKPNNQLVTSLDNINKQQQALLKEINKSEGQIKTAADSVIKQNQENESKVAEIKNLISVASNEQALAKLAPAASEADAKQDQKPSDSALNTTSTTSPETTVKKVGGTNPASSAAKAANEKENLNTYPNPVSAGLILEPGENQYFPAP